MMKKKTAKKETYIKRYLRKLHEENMKMLETITGQRIKSIDGKFEKALETL
ncbi:MAG: hypothetical protein Q8P52_00840 [bacterium]|nr:hypothetical protein [bacterium]